MENRELLPDIIDVLLKLMRETFGGQFNGYYEGDPLQFPAASLPAIVVEKVNEKITDEDAPTNTDDYYEQVSIKVVLNKLDDVNADDTVDLTERKLRRIVAGRDPVTRNFAEGTVVGTLRANLSLGAYKIKNDIDISYDITPRPNMQMTSEGIVSILTKEHIFVPNRTS